MEFLLALIVLVAIVWFTKSVFWAVVYIVGACIIVWAYRKFVKKTNN